MRLNKVHNLGFLDNGLPDKSLNLIIADPPYFNVKGDFDFIWPSFGSYLKDVEMWAAECKRLLSDNGTLIWYGSSKRIAYTQLILDKHFVLLNNAVWDKGSFMGLEKSAALRTLAPCTERLLIYSNETDNETPYVKGVRSYIRKEILSARGKIVLKEINKALGSATNGGGVASSCLSLSKSEPTMITRDNYQKLRSWLGSPFLAKDYNDLLVEYRTKRRPFNNFGNLQEVLRFPNQTHIATNYDHETVKPEKLSRALILTFSRHGDVIGVPFAGSGTECAMAAQEGRSFIGYELNQKYVEMANSRCEPHLSQTKLSI